MAKQTDLVTAGLWPETARLLADDQFRAAPTVAAGSTLTMNVTHLDKVILLDTAAGSTVTLPASSGGGAVYRFKVSTTVTSNNHVIKVANATDVMRGALSISGATPGLFVPATTGDTITMNGTTTGGVVGTFITVVDEAAGFFNVSGFVTGSGISATPFSATV